MSAHDNPFGVLAYRKRNRVAISFPKHLQTDFQERQFHHHDLRNGWNLRVAGDQSGTRSLEQINATGRDAPLPLTCSQRTAI